MDGKNYLVETDASVGANEMMDSIKLLKYAFPQMTNEAFDLLVVRAIQKEIPAKHFHKMALKIIDLHEFPTFTIGKFFAERPKKRVYNYREICDYISDNPDHHHNDVFECHKPDGQKPFWTKKQ